MKRTLRKMIFTNKYQLVNHRWRRESKRGFTLIELSIVLIIIGLIVGGVLVGQDMIRASEVRATIAQIDKYNSATNTFRGKFNALPGDMPVATAQQFGFVVGLYCNGRAGSRDGDGLIEGIGGNAPYTQLSGETGLFWEDISSAVAGNLIDGQFPNSGAPFVGCNSPTPGLTTTLGTTFIGDYFPSAKIGHGNYIYVYSYSGFNWYGISMVTSTDTGADLFSSTSITAAQAYNIDKKVDDGLPTTGSVQAAYVNGGLNNAPNTTTSGGNATSCYDTTTSAYSITYNNGSGANCALSMRFQ